MDLQPYKDKHPHMTERLTKLETEAKIAEIMLDLKNHEGMKRLLEELESIVKAINVKLLTYERMETEERERLLADKERCMWLINKFPGYERSLERINKFLEKL